MRSVKEIFVQNKNESSGEKLRSSGDWEWYFQISENELTWESRLRFDFSITLKGLKSFFWKFIESRNEERDLPRKFSSRTRMTVLGRNWDLVEIESDTLELPIMS